MTEKRGCDGVNENFSKPSRNRFAQKFSERKEAFFCLDFFATFFIKKKSLKKTLLCPQERARGR